MILIKLKNKIIPLLAISLLSSSVLVYADNEKVLKQDNKQEISIINENLEKIKKDSQREAMFSNDTILNKQLNVNKYYKTSLKAYDKYIKEAYLIKDTKILDKLQKQLLKDEVKEGQIFSSLVGLIGDNKQVFNEEKLQENVKDIISNRKEVRGKGGELKQKISSQKDLLNTLNCHENEVL